MTGKHLTELRNHEHYRGLVELRREFDAETPAEKELLEEINWAIVTMVKQARELDKLDQSPSKRKERTKSTPHLRLV